MLAKYDSYIQKAVVCIGIWFLLNAIFTFAANHNFQTGTDIGSSAYAISVRLNGWHGILHLVPGLLAFPLALKRSGAIKYCLTFGGLYVVIGISGLIEGQTVYRLIAVDLLGNTVHILEGLFMLAIGLAANRSRSPGSQPS